MMESIPAISARSLQYYVIARRWASDLEFFRIETAFFHRLINDYILQLKDNNRTLQLLGTGKKLDKLENDEVQASGLLVEQIKQLGLMAEDIIPEDAEALTATQLHLEYFMTNLTKEYREVKQEIFRLIALDKQWNISAN